LLVLHRILHRHGQFRTDGLENTQVIRAKGILLDAVERKNTHQSVHAFQRQCQSRAQGAKAPLFTRVARFDRWISIHDGFPVLRNPSA
jgi:hypothetical protein